MKTWNVLLATICVLFFFTSTQVTAQSITGKWIFSDKSETVEFTEDGVFRSCIQNQGCSYGIYQLDQNGLSFIYFDLEDEFFYSVEKLTRTEFVLLNQEKGERYVYNYVGNHEIPGDELQTIAAMLNQELDEPAIQKQETRKYDPVNKEANRPTQSDKVKPAPPSRKHPPGNSRSSAIVGTWQVDDGAGRTLLTLTEDHYFVRQIWVAEIMRDIYPDPEVSRGKYKFDGKVLTLLPFDAVIKGQYEEIKVEGLNNEGFRVPFDFYGEMNYSQWTYKGFVQLSDEDRTSFLSWNNYLKLIGQWATEEEVFKFMGDGIAFVGKPNATCQMLFYSTLGDNLRFQKLDAAENDFLFTGDITKFTPSQFLLNSKDNIYAYTFKGEPILTQDEIYMYSNYLSASHRTSMRIIDVMDGVKDWIWKEKEEY